MDIHDWWNRARRDDGSLKLSSRRLLVIVAKLPDDSAVKMEAAGDWPREAKLASAILNELRIMRSENAVFNGNEYREPVLVKTPAQQLADEFSAEHNQNIRSGIMAQLQRKN